MFFFFPFFVLGVLVKLFGPRQPPAEPEIEHRDMTPVEFVMYILTHEVTAGFVIGALAPHCHPVVVRVTLFAYILGSIAIEFFLWRSTW